MQPERGVSDFVSLVLEGLVKRFGTVEALRGLSLEIPRGTVFGLIGPNGAGKTTTMRAILRIVEPDAGRIAWDGQPVERLPLSTFGYLPEERGLYPKMRVREELRFFGELHGMLRRSIDEAVERFAELLRMHDILDRKVEDLSKGNAQKVQFAAACIHRPPVLILDEPFGGLDPVNVRLFKRAVGRLRADGTTILFSSHRMEHVEELCDGVCLISGGRVVIQGRVDQVRRATGRRVLRLAWEQEDEGARALLDSLVRRGWQVSQGANGVWQISWTDGQVETAEEARDLLASATSVGLVRLWELTYPSLEDVYVETVGAGALEEDAVA